MDSHLKKLFLEAKLQPQEGLSSEIWTSLVRIQNHRRSIQLWLNSTILILSFTALFPVIRQLILGFTESGFSQYISLVFSDTGLLATYWKELALSLADSLPTTSLILTFSLVFILFVSLRRLATVYRHPLQVA